MDELVARTKTEAATAPLEKGHEKNRFSSLIYLLILLLVVLGAWWLLAPPKLSGKGPEQAPQQVGAAKIGKGDVRDVLTGLGTVTPLATVTVQTQISGQLIAVGFKEGQIVQKGDFLAQIDPRPYQAALDQAQGTLVHDKGLLNQAESDLKRYEILSKKNYTSVQQTVDQQFLVEQDKGTVMVDEAAIETAKLNLIYCHIVAPVTGRVGLRLVDPGNYLQPTNTTALVVLTQLQPISVVFVLPEDDIQSVWKEFRGGKTLSVAAYNRVDANQIGIGALESVDNEVDTSTGTVKLRALFPNTNELLFPNQFVNARLLLRTLQGVTVAPLAAIQNGAPGAFVYVIKPDNTVAVQVVTTGVTDGNQIQILSGVKAGDTVVVDGADRLRDGAKVQIAPDQADPAAGMNDGPGAPPGQQPNNALPIPKSERLEERGPKSPAKPSPTERSDVR